MEVPHTFEIASAISDPSEPSRRFRKPAGGFKISTLDLAMFSLTTFMMGSAGPATSSARRHSSKVPGTYLFRLLRGCCLRIL